MKSEVLIARKPRNASSCSYSAREGPAILCCVRKSAGVGLLTEALGGRLDLYRESLDAGRFGLTDEYLATFCTFLRDKCNKDST